MQHTCKNCNNVYEDSFCNKCGQKTVHRYTIGHVLHEVMHVFTHADKGIFSFAWNIIRKPGIVALDLVEGRRKRYFNLFQYLLIIVGFTTFLLVKADVIGNTVKTMNAANNFQMSARQAEFQMQVSGAMQKYNNIIQIILIPIFALFSWLFVARKQYNYAETIVLHSVSSAQTNTFAIITTALLLFPGKFFNIFFVGILSLAVMLFSFTLAYRQFFKLSVIKSFLFGLLVLICTYIVQMLLTTVVTVIFLLVNRGK
jgi:hypothetical protein